MRLNLGAGSQDLDGFIAVDIEGGDVRHDLGAFPWPVDPDSVTEIMASHILEHFDRHTGRAFLAECYRILMPGGVLRLAVPDSDVFTDCRLAGDWDAVRGYPWIDANHFYGGDHTEERPHWRHKYAYTFGLLEHILRDIGFVLVTRRGPCELDNQDYAHISLYLDAIK